MNYAEHGLNEFVHNHDSSTDNVNKAIKQWANDDTNGLVSDIPKFVESFCLTRESSEVPASEISFVSCLKIENDEKLEKANGIKN